MQKPGMSAEEIGKTIVDCYISSHPGDTDITLSVVKLSRVKALTAAVKELSLAILSEYSLEALKPQATAVMEEINNAVIYKNNALDWESAGGISVYFPEAGPMVAQPPELQYFYKSQIVSFAGDGLWHDLLTSCYVLHPEPGPPIQMLINIRRNMKTLDPDKVDLYDLCTCIVNYPAP